MLNKVLLIGNVGNDPDVKVLSNGSKVVNLSVATTEYWKDKSGERQSRTEWHRVVVYNDGLVKVIEKYVHKGSKVYVEGSSRSRKYKDSTGVERTSVEVIVQGYSDTVKLLDRLEGGSNSSKKKEDEDEFSRDSKEEYPAETDDEVPF